MASDKSGRSDRTVYDQSSNESLRPEANSAGQKIQEAGLQIKSKVADLGADAQEATAEQVTTLQRRLAEGITAYADTADEASRAFADKEFYSNCRADAERSRSTARFGRIAVQQTDRPCGRRSA